MTRDIHKVPTPNGGWINRNKTTIVRRLRHWRERRRMIRKAAMCHRAADYIYKIGFHNEVKAQGYLSTAKDNLYFAAIRFTEMADEERRP